MKFSDRDSNSKRHEIMHFGDPFMTEQEIQKLAADYAALLSEYAALKEEIALMQQQNDWMKKQLFGRKTEQTSVIMEGGTQLSMFSDENEKNPEPSEEVVTVAEHKRKKNAHTTIG